MIKNNKFHINNLSAVVLMGQSEVLDQLITINKLLKLKTLIVAKKEQEKFINKKFEYKIFNKIDNKFKKFQPDLSPHSTRLIRKFFLENKNDKENLIKTLRF